MLPITTDFLYFYVLYVLLFELVLQITPDHQSRGTIVSLDDDDDDDDDIHVVKTM